MRDASFRNRREICKENPHEYNLIKNGPTGVVEENKSYLDIILKIEKCFMPSPKSLDLGDKKVSIQMPTINEEYWIEDALASIVNQPLYKRENKRKKLRLIVLDSSSTDCTTEIAKRYIGDDNIWIAPNGKLNARDFGIRNDDADIIISVDADTVYPIGWLSTILQPFNDPSVIMTHGPKFRFPDEKIFCGFVRRLNRIYINLLKQSTSIQKIFHHVTATNSAFKREIYLENPFRLDIDQLNRYILWIEEEFYWPYRMERFGKVIYLPDTGILTSARNNLVSFDPHAMRYKEERKKGMRF